MLKTMIQNLMRIAQEEESYEPYYEVLEYIQTSGVEYFDTGVILSSTSKVEMGITYTGVPSSGSSYAFGAFGNNKNFGINGAFNANPTKWYGVWGSASTLTSSTLNPALNTKYDIEMSSSGIYANGERISTVSGTFTGEQSAYLMWAHTTSQPKTIGRIHYVKIYDNGVLVVDYIPVLDSQLRPCLYDKISKTFLYAIGNDSNTITYKRWNKFDVDYISSDGNQYVTTSIYPDQNTSIEVCASTSDWGYVPTSSDSRSTNIFGSGSVSATDAYTFGICNKSSDTTGRRGGVAISGMTGSLNTKYVLYQDNSGASYNDNALTYGGTLPNIKATTNPLTFFRNPLSAVTGQVSLYYAKVWQSNNLILSLKPTVWHNGNTTAVACLYDEVYNKMYTNAGTGSFKAYIVGANDTVYEVGSNCFATPTSSSNYFDSGLYGNEKWNVKLLAYTSTNITGSNYGQLFGAIRGSQYTENLTINTTGATGSGATSRFDSKSNPTTSTSTVFNMGADTKALCIINGMGMWQDNVQKYAWSNPDEFTTQNTCLILKAQGSTSLRPNGCCYCLIEENQTPIAEYIPVKNAGDSSSYGLYDRVSGTLNTGVGTHTFNSLS